MASLADVLLVPLRSDGLELLLAWRGLRLGRRFLLVGPKRTETSRTFGGSERQPA